MRRDARGQDRLPRRRSQLRRLPVCEPEPFGVVRVNLDERLVLQGLLQLMSAVAESPLVDEQRIREENKAAGLVGGGPDGLRGTLPSLG